ncbi:MULTISPECIES: potassium channel family protein [unclassified Cryobacterium]|uniref:potassium channel family protein n=1 Tax=unclassified Cryobacterium TaxID=2649013 RepID=UPI0014473811|nr:MULTISPECIES: potassium channel family protein [unclassified Cryobacterium]
MVLSRWQQLTQWPMVAAAVVFTVVYAWVVIANVQAPDDAVPRLVLAAIWLIFAVEYVVCIVLAEARGEWFRTHLVNLAAVMVPILRPLLLLRLLRLVPSLRAETGTAVRGRLAIYAVATSVLLIFMGALAVLDAEQNAPGANITEFADAAWWVAVTVTSVGYGDYFPVTAAGRWVAVGLMFGGLALLGTVAATLSSWLIDRVRSRHGGG